MNNFEKKIMNDSLSSVLVDDSIGIVCDYISHDFLIRNRTNTIFKVIDKFMNNMLKEDEKRLRTSLNKAQIFLSKNWKESQKYKNHKYIRRLREEWKRYFL